MTKKRTIAYHAGLETQAPEALNGSGESLDTPDETPFLKALRDTISSQVFDDFVHTDETIHPLLTMERCKQPDSAPTELATASPTRETLASLPVLDTSSSKTSEYMIDHLLDQGGMGVLHVAHQRSLGRDVVVKRVKSSARNEGATLALLQEGQLTGKLEHPNIVPIHALGLDDEGHPSLVMKRIEGTSWRELICDPKHPAWAQVSGNRLLWHLEVLVQVCHAVSFAHSRGVIHRDIKPANVMIGAFGEVYLLDWGIAEYLHKLDQSTPSPPSGLVGSPAYMAPEMLPLHPENVGPHTDVYLLGATLHEALVGRPRHLGSSCGEVLMSAAVSAPYEYPNELPDELAAICNRATHPELAERFPDVAAFKQAIVDFLQHRVSNQWSNQAYSRLQELQSYNKAEESNEQQSNYYRLVHECRFGFRQALEEWPGNSIAQERLQALLHTAFAHEIEERHHPEATALLSEMKEPPAHFQQQVDDLAQEILVEQQHKEKLLDLEYQHDLSISSAERRFLLKVLLSILGVIFPTFIVLGYCGIRPINNLHRWTFTCVIFGASCLITFIKRKELFKNSANRLITVVFLSSTFLLALNRGAAVKWGMPMQYTLLADTLIFASVSVTMGLTIFRWAWYLAFIALLTAVSIIFIPTLGPLLFGLGMLAGMGTVIFFLIHEDPPQASTTK